MLYGVINDITKLVVKHISSYIKSTNKRQTHMNCFISAFLSNCGVIYITRDSLYCLPLIWVLKYHLICVAKLEKKQHLIACKIRHWTIDPSPILTWWAWPLVCLRSDITDGCSLSFKIWSVEILIIAGSLSQDCSFLRAPEWIPLVGEIDIYEWYSLAQIWNNKRK